jgi:CheY-like chemotaxis protein
MNEKIKVLIVEDDRDIRKNLKILLESEGYVVDLAENGQVALDLLQTIAVLPSMIILDLMMPVMDGFQFRDQQKKHPRFANIPVAIMTADGHIEEKKVKTQADAALRKPANIDDILDLVKKLAVTG